ncbi:MAG TPA: M48 family metallopeptidase [Candidatus Methanoperedenaceae archaeon]|nr:M48 family metallopeptidase [Candidatus Methanoperedenaceae archaeon]
MERHVRINGIEIPYNVSHRRVRYPRLEFTKGNLLVVLPKSFSDESELLEKHSSWIYRKYVLIRQSLENAGERTLSERTDAEFRALVESLVREYAGELDVTVSTIRYRTMRSKWGSCSSDRNLTFNTRLKFLPARLIEYVVFHEVAHIVQMRHNSRFWKIVHTRWDNHKKYESDLQAYWFLIQGNAGG